MNKIISVKNFSKSFGDTQVIHNLNFDVYEKEIFAFLGPNGSGKTTTIRCLLGIYQPSNGELLIDGQKYHPDKADILGYLPEERGLYTNTKVLETMVYFGQIKGLTYTEARGRSQEYLKRVELSDKENIQIKKLSSGQQQKIQLGITIINRPKLLILDEPTKGLDPLNRKLLTDILKELNEEGATIIFSSHQMDEVERIADRLIMINKGNQALYGDLNEVKEQFNDNSADLSFALPEGMSRFPESKMYKIKNSSKKTAEIKIKNNVEPDEVLKFLIQKNISILKFELTLPTLDEIFIKVTEEK